MDAPKKGDDGYLKILHSQIGGFENCDEIFGKNFLNASFGGPKLQLGPKRLRNFFSKIFTSHKVGLL